MSRKSVMQVRAEIDGDISNFAANDAENTRTVVLGLEHFIDKIGYQAKEYARRGIDVRYLVLDRSGLSSEKIQQYDANALVVPTPLLKRLWYTIGQFRTFRPSYCELYDIGRLTLVYALLARIWRAHLILILRGGEMSQRNEGRLRRWGLALTLKLCDRVVAKELNIVRDLEHGGVGPDKVTFIGNCVPAPTQEPTAILERSIDILYLNSIRRSRNVDLLIHALPAVLARHPEVRVVVAGFTHLNGTSYVIEADEERRVMEIVEELGLAERIEIKGFVSQPYEFFGDAKLFVLPADVIFANYALLESMACGVVPVVGDGEGADRIVVSGVNGMIVPRNAEALSERMIHLLEQPAVLDRLSLEARRTIESRYSIRQWGAQMVATRNEARRF